MTIPYEVIIGERLTQDQEAAIQQLIAQSFDEIDATYNKWNPRSELSHVNALAAHTSMTLSPQLSQFLKRTEYFVKNCPYFDPTIEPLQALWKQKFREGIFPTENELERVRSVIGWNMLLLDGNHIAKKHAETALDLGGIAKGFFVDMLTEKLIQAGYRSLFVEWGGEIRAHGIHPDQRPWSAGIASFDTPPQKTPIQIIPLLNKAIATSGDYLQNWTLQGVMYSHVFDPITLYPRIMSDQSIASATVIASNCVTADALATTLLLCTDIEEATRVIQDLQNRWPDTDYCVIARSGSMYTTLYQED